MRNENDKAQIELSIFNKFLTKSGLSVDPASITKGDADKGEPDILCTRNSGSPIAFELAEACAPEFAEGEVRAARSPTGVFATWGNDVSEKTLLKKLQKTYAVSCPIDLLLYTDGRTALPDEVILLKLLPYVESDSGQFDRVWLMGEKVHRVGDDDG